MCQLPDINELVLYRKRREPSLALVTSHEGKDLKIFTEDGKQVSVSTDKIALNTGIHFNESMTNADIKLEFRSLRDQLEKNRANIDLYTLWDCVADEGGEYGFGYIAELYYGSGSFSEDQALELFWAIDKDDVYFKRLKNSYVPNTREEVAETLHRKEKERQREKDFTRAVEWAESVQSGNTGKQKSIRDFDPDYYKELVKKFVIYNDSPEKIREARKFTTKIGIKSQEDAVEFLIKAGVCSELDDPVTLALEPYEKFSSRIKKEVSDIISGNITTCKHSRIHSLPTYSIDDKSTKDIDDAISITEDGDTFEVSVHITNAGFLIEKWSALDIESMMRGESVYLPEKTINMLPDKLVEQKLSLFEGHPRTALSLFINFDKDSNVIDYCFKQTELNVDKNLTYENSELLFEKEPWAKKLMETAMALRSRREQNGAFILQLPDLKFHINDSDNISITKNLMDTVPHIVIAEFMILTNYLAARYLKEREVPCIYRTQTESIDSEARELDRNDPLFPIKVVKYLKPSRLSLQPQSHSSLGLDLYTQVTSPIRRYLDMVVQRQIISMAENTGICYSEQELLEIIERTGTGMIDRRQAQNSRKKYWIFRYLKKNFSDIEGYVSAVEENRMNVYFPDILLELPVQKPNKISDLRQGSRVKVDIEKVDPLRRRINLKFNSIICH